MEVDPTVIIGDFVGGSPMHRNPRSYPDMIERRRFLAAVGTTALVWPRTLEALQRTLPVTTRVDDEDFWRLVRSCFLIPAGRIYLNNGTLGPSPAVVVEAVAEHVRRVAATFPPGVAWSDVKGALGSLVDADPEGFVFPRSTTEAMSFIANGLELEPGATVVTTDHEHIGGLCPWQLLEARRGVRLDTVRLPVPARSSEELLAAIWAGVDASTRVLSVSHVTFTTGTRLPVGRLAGRCREAGIVLVVDGAHPPGMIRIGLRSVAADFYASSPHKWLLAPQGTGLLYLAPRWRTELWPTLASGGWDDLSLGAQRLNHLGTFDESRIAGLLAAVEFQRAIGVERIEARVRYLSQRIRTHLDQIPGVRVFSPHHESLQSGMVSFSLAGVESLALQRYLADAGDVRTRVIGEYDYGWMRLSTHIYNTPDEIDQVAALIDHVARHGLDG